MPLSSRSMQRVYLALACGIGRIWAFWVLTFAFGLGGTLPLFLYARERRLEASSP
jgi:hypothetical protein